MIACSDIRHDASEGDHGRYRLTDIQMTAEQSRSRPSREQPRASNFWTFESIFCISVSVFCPRDEVTARCGRRLDVFDWGRGGAGRRRYWTLLSKRLTVPPCTLSKHPDTRETVYSNVLRRYWTLLSKRLTILKIYSVTGHGLCQKGSQYVAIDREGTTIRDFTPQDPFPGVSIDQPITFNQHPKNIYVMWVEGSHGSELGQLTLEMHQIIVTGRSIRGRGREVFAHPDQGKGWPFADNLTSGTWLGGRAQLADWRDHWRQLMGHRWPGHRLRAVLPSACYR